MEPPALSEGHRLFLQVQQSGREMAKALGVSPMSVSRYRKGTFIPDDGVRRKMSDLWGIPPDAWTRQPGESPVKGRVTQGSSETEDPRDSFAAKPKRVRKKKGKPAPEPQVNPSQAGAISVSGFAKADPIEEYDRQIQMLAEAQADPEVTDLARTRYASEIGRLLSQKATVSAKLETVETRFWKLPAAKRLADSLLGLVERYPQIEDELLAILERAQ